MADTAMVKIAGVELPKRKAARDLRVPGPSAKLVLTDTTTNTLRLMAEAISHNEPVMLDGETGGGKSADVRYLAYRTKTPLYWVNLCEQTDPAEFIGKYVPTVDSDRFAWMDGVLIQAMKQGAWLFLDDINLAPASILERINSLLDEDAFIMMTEHTGKKVVPKEGFRLFAARNPLTYQGRQRLSVAFINKFTQIYVEEQTDEEKTRILSQRGVSKKTASEMVGFAGRLVAGLKEEKLDRSRLGGYRFGLRDLLRWAEYIEIYTKDDEEGLALGTVFSRGAMYVYYDRLETRDARKLCFDLLSLCSIDETPLALAEILEGRDLAADIKPTVAELFAELAKDVDRWEVQATCALAGSEQCGGSVFNSAALAAMPSTRSVWAETIEETLGQAISDKIPLAREHAINTIRNAGFNSESTILRLIEQLQVDGVGPICSNILNTLATVSPMHPSVISAAVDSLSDSNEMVRSAARRLLKKEAITVDKLAVETLLRVLPAQDDAGIALSMIDKLLPSADHRKSVDVVIREKLHALLDSSDEEHQVRAASLLIGLGEQSLSNFFLKTLETGSSATAVRLALDSLSKRGQGDTVAAKILFRLCDSKISEKSDELRDVLYWGLSEGNPSADTIAWLVGQVANAEGVHWRQRVSAARSLGSIADADIETVDVLLNVVQHDPEAAVRQQAARSLLGLEHIQEEMLCALIPVLREETNTVPSEGVGSQVASAFGRRALDDVKAREVLLQAFRTTDSENPRRNIAEALQTYALCARDQTSKDVQDALLDALRTDNDAWVRYHAAGAFEHILLPETATDALSDGIGHNHDWHSISAGADARAVHTLTDKHGELIPILVQRIEGESDADTTSIKVARKCASLLAGILETTGSAADKAINILADRCLRKDRCDALLGTALGRIGRSTDKAKQALLHWVQTEKDWLDKQSAYIALGRLGSTDDDVTNALLSGLRSERDERVQDGAITAIRLLAEKEPAIMQKALLVIDALPPASAFAARRNLARLVGQTDWKRVDDAVQSNVARLAFYLDGSDTDPDVSALRAACEIRGGPGGTAVPTQETAELILTRVTVSRLRSLLPAVHMNHAVALVGETGVGKTALIRFLAYLTNNNYVRINLKDMAEVSELVGSYVPTEDGPMVWQDGLLVEAMKEGYWVVLDEANLAGPGILERLNQLLDRGGYLELQERGNQNDEPITPDGNFRLFVTMNPTDYAGRNALSPAFANRFVVKWFEKPTSKELIAIVKEKYGVSDGVARRLVTFHKSIADSAEHRELGRQRAERYVYTLRDLQSLMLRVQRHGNRNEIVPADLVRCARDVYGARLSHSEDRELFETHLRTCFK